MKEKTHFENLDGLRFLCFMSVFLFHSFNTEIDSLKHDPIYLFIKSSVFGNGNLGVNFFFVLSGFLITFLLMEEKRINGKINMLHFWLRRLLRIWPLYFFCVFFGFIIFPYLKLLLGKIPDETADPVYYLLFINNFDFINKGSPDASVLGVLWSIAIEEQFYLIWPILLAILPIHFYWIAFSIVIAASLIFRGFNDQMIMHDYHTLSCIGDMAVGALGAWLINCFPRFKNGVKNLAKIHISFIYGFFITSYFFRDEILINIPELKVFERGLIAIIILSIILEQNYSQNSFFKMSQFKRISKLGIITYGLYCLHFIGILFTTTLNNKLGFNNQLWQVIILETTLALIVTIVMSYLSYKYFETPFLILKHKFTYIATTKTN